MDKIVFKHARAHLFFRYLNDLLYCYLMLIIQFNFSSGVIEYTDCFSAEE